MGKKERDYVKEALRAAQDAIDAGTRVGARRLMKEERALNISGSDSPVQAAGPLRVGAPDGLPTDPGPIHDTGDPDLNWLIGKESSWKPTAKNPKSSAFGLGQLIKLNRETYGKRLGYDPNTTDMAEQLGMMREYIRDRYKTPQAARRFWEQHGYY